MNFPSAHPAKASESRRYYVQGDGKESGPYGENELLEAIANGRISACAYYREEFASDWRPLSEFAAQMATESASAQKPTRFRLVVGIVLLFAPLGLLAYWVATKPPRARTDWKKEEQAKKWYSDPKNREWAKKIRAAD